MHGCTCSSCQIINPDVRQKCEGTAHLASGLIIWHLVHVHSCTVDNLEPERKSGWSSLDLSLGEVLWTSLWVRFSGPESGWSSLDGGPSQFTALRFRELHPDFLSGHSADFVWSTKLDCRAINRDYISIKYLIYLYRYMYLKIRGNWLSVYRWRRRAILLYK